MSEYLHWVGLDVGSKQVDACITDATGRILQQGSVDYNPDGLDTFLRPHVSPSSTVLGMEAGSFAIFLARKMRALGYQVRVFEARQASKFLDIRHNKTDRNDARSLADLTRLGGGSVRKSHVKRVEIQMLKSKLVIRRKLSIHRLAIENLIGQLFRLNGGKRAKYDSSGVLLREVKAEIARLQTVEGVDLSEDIEPLLELAVAIRRQEDVMTRRLRKLAEGSEICRRFMEIPGVGPLSALSFYTAIEDPTRFIRSDDVGAYLGLAPRLRQSGGVEKRGTISKRGDRVTRTLLVGAAARLMFPSARDTDLKAWGLAVKSRAGGPRARVAVARKLSTVMLAMWKTGDHFKSRSEAIDAPQS